jgi:hypothetical protein
VGAGRSTTSSWTKMPCLRDVVQPAQYLAAHLDVIEWRGPHVLEGDLDREDTPNG